MASAVQWSSYNFITPILTMVNFLVLLPTALESWTRTTTTLDFVLVGIGVWLALRFVRNFQDAHRFPQTRMWPSKVDKIVREGVYAKKRQPVISAVIYMNLSYVFLFRSIALLAIVPFFVAVWYVLARYFDTLLEQKFGDDYRSYRSRTGLVRAGEGFDEWSGSGFKVN